MQLASMAVNKTHFNYRHYLYAPLNICSIRQFIHMYLCICEYHPYAHIYVQALIFMYKVHAAATCRTDRWFFWRVNKPFHASALRHKKLFRFLPTSAFIAMDSGATLCMKGKRVFVLQNFYLYASVGHVFRISFWMHCFRMHVWKLCNCCAA